MHSEVIAGLGSRADYVARVPNIDAGRLQLSDDEGTVFSLVGRASQISDVLTRCGLPEAKAIAVLLKLRAKGAIVPARVQAAAPQVVADAAGAETIDLPEDRKAEILEMERSLDSRNAFELLGVPNGTSASEARAAFYALSRKFHPDRFFGKSLGSFRGRIEKIFLRLSWANENVGDEGKRAAYLRANPRWAVSDVPAPVTTVQKVAAPPPVSKPAPVDPVREAERRARLSRHPYLAKNARVNELMARARESLEKGNPGHAFTDINMAAQIDPRNEEVKALLIQTRHANEAERSNAELKRGIELLEQQNPHSALQSFKSAVSVNAHNGKAAFEAAKLLWHNDNNVKEASSYAQKAVEAEPKKRRLPPAAGPGARRSRVESAVEKTLRRGAQARAEQR